MPQEAVKITCSTEDLDAKLSKSMRLLGVHHDQYGRLLNAENQYVAGLNQARIKMGDYIDAQGRARDANGNFLDGLTATELKLRYFKDELGNVYNAEGELVRVSEELAKAHAEKLAAAEAEAAKQAEEAARAQEELATAGQRGMQSLLGGAKGAAKMAQNLSMMIGVLGGGNEGLTKFGQNVVIATQTFSQFALAMKTLPKFIQGFKLLTVATQGQTAAQVILNAVSGNWVALIAGGLAAGTLAYKSLKNSTKETAEATKQLTKQIDELTVAYKMLQNRRGSMKGADEAYNAGAIAASVTEVQVLEERRKTVEDLTDAYKKQGEAVAAADKALREYESTHSSYDKNLQSSWLGRVVAAPFGGTDYGNAQKEVQEALKKQGEAKEVLDQATQDFSRAVESMIQKDLPRDEMKELQDRAKQYSDALASGALTEEAKTNVEKALIENQKKQEALLAEQHGLTDLAKEKKPEYVPPQSVEDLNARIKEAAEIFGETSDSFARVKASYEDQFAEVQRQNMAEAQKKLGDKFLQYADGSALWTAQERAAAELEETIAVWTENAKTAGATQEELDAAVANLTKEYNDKRLQEYLDANNLKIKHEEKLTAEEEYKQTLDRIREAEETYGLQAVEAEKLRAQAAEDYAAALKRQEEEAEQQKENRLSELGITGLREQMKSPYEKMIEQQQKVAQAAEEGLISAAEASKMQAKLAADYWEQNGPKQGEISGEDEAPVKQEEYRRAATMTYGSNELYQAMTQKESSTDRYQNNITKTLNNMDRYTEDNNELLQTIQSNLGDMMKGLGVI